MYYIKSHIHFQVSPSTSEIFNKNLKIGLPYILLRLTELLPSTVRLNWLTTLTLHCPQPSSSTTGYTRKSGIIILLYMYLYWRTLISSITTLLVKFGRSFSFRSTALLSRANFVSLVLPVRQKMLCREERALLSWGKR